MFPCSVAASQFYTNRVLSKVRLLDWKSDRIKYTVRLQYPGVSGLVFVVQMFCQLIHEILERHLMALFA